MLPEIIIGGLGPGSDNMVPETSFKLARDYPTFLRTQRHPCAHLFSDAKSFDDLYESQTSVEKVYTSIVERLLSEAERQGTIAYLLPGSPLVAERTVDLLREQEDVAIQVIPSISFLDLAWERLRVDPVAGRVTIINGQNFENEIIGLTGPVLVAQCDDRLVLSDIKVSIDMDKPPVVTVLQRLGLESENVFQVDWEQLDRDIDPDHLTCLWVSELPTTTAIDAMTHLHAVVGRLRAECPWDREQTHASLVSGLLEEANEVVEAIELVESDNGSFDGLIEELGDLLFHIALQSAIGEEKGIFDLGDVARGIHDKMVRRHPHIFDRHPETPMPSPEQLAEQWKAIKAAEEHKA
ncbi:MAG: MazG nucleotide pyrophosphohydrolase domain-containing protein [Acidimicrobiales bacterium]|nr:MazG nucleotide pyrophosphohydrolase domain-containing protein [Acidimicrobiales bacterium]